VCGRYVLTSDVAAIQQKFNLTDVPAQLEPRYNIAPTQPVPVITNQARDTLDFHRWGLIPSWSKDMSIGSRMINARSETAHEKPAFRAAFKRRRCLIPANGFYEWTQTDDSKNKTPMFVHMKGQALFAFAGLWEVWYSTEGDEVRSCTILTSTPNDLVKPLHHRMAVVLREDDYDTWLSPDELGPDVLKPLLQPIASDKMDVYEVSRVVNSPANDVPECIVPINASPQ
jgi:putative SOS response-associated peptidase YedK